MNQNSSIQNDILQIHRMETMISHEIENTLKLTIAIPPRNCITISKIKQSQRFANLNTPDMLLWRTPRHPGMEGR